jgi:hypothetical protein
MQSLQPVARLEYKLAVVFYRQIKVARVKTNAEPRTAHTVNYVDKVLDRTVNKLGVVGRVGSEIFQTNGNILILDMLCYDLQLFDISFDLFLLADGQVHKIVAVKEASGSIEQMQEILDGKPENFLVISGDDGITVELIKRGGAGVISVAANAFPQHFCRCIHNAIEGNLSEAEQAMENFAEPLALLFKEGNPTGVKTMTAAMGITRPEVRLPLVEGTEELYEATKKVVTKYDLR